MRCLGKVILTASAFTVLSSCLLFLPHAFAVGSDFDITRIEYGFRVRSGNESISSGFTGLGDIGGFPQKWGVITVHFSSKPEWADDVMIKYYVLVRDPKGKPSMFTGSASYVSVHAGLDHMGFIFLHPNSLARYGAVKRIEAEIWCKGVLADFRQWPGKSEGTWWNKVAPISGALRARLFTPFEHDYEVREEDIKLVLSP